MSNAKPGVAQVKPGGLPGWKHTGGNPDELVQQQKPLQTSSYGFV